MSKEYLDKIEEEFNRKLLDIASYEFNDNPIVASSEYEGMRQRLWTCVKEYGERERQRTGNAIKEGFKKQFANIKAYLPTELADKYIDEILEQLKN